VAGSRRRPRRAGAGRRGPRAEARKVQALKAGDTLRWALIDFDQRPPTASRYQQQYRHGP
jgi:hypothetical protein